MLGRDYLTVLHTCWLINLAVANNIFMDVFFVLPVLCSVVLSSQEVMTTCVLGKGLSPCTTLYIHIVYLYAAWLLCSCWPIFMDDLLVLPLPLLCSMVGRSDKQGCVLGRSVVLSSTVCGYSAGRGEGG